MGSYTAELWSQADHMAPRELFLYSQLEPLTAVKRGWDAWTVPDVSYLSASGYNGHGFTLTLKNKDQASVLIEQVNNAIGRQAHPYDVGSALADQMQVWTQEPGTRHHVRRWLERFNRSQRVRYSLGCSMREPYRLWNERYNTWRRTPEGRLWHQERDAQNSTRRNAQRTVEQERERLDERVMSGEIDYLRYRSLAGVYEPITWPLLTQEQVAERQASMAQRAYTVRAPEGHMSPDNMMDTNGDFIDAIVYFTRDEARRIARALGLRWEVAYEGTNLSREEVRTALVERFAPRPARVSVADYLRVSPSAHEWTIQENANFRVFNPVVEPEPTTPVNPDETPF